CIARANSLRHSGAREGPRTFSVMPALVAGIHAWRQRKGVDGRDIRALTHVFDGLCPAMTSLWFGRPSLVRQAFAVALLNCHSPSAKTSIRMPPMKNESGCGPSFSNHWV